MAKTTIAKFVAVYLVILLPSLSLARAATSRNQCSVINDQIVSGVTEYYPESARKTESVKALAALRQGDDEAFVSNVDKNCKGGCENFLVWIVGQGNSATLRSYAHEKQIELVVKRLKEYGETLDSGNGGGSPRSLLLEYFSRRAAGAETKYSETADERLSEVVEKIKSHAYCNALCSALKYVLPSGVVSALSASAQESGVGALSADYFSTPVFADKVVFSYPDSWKWILADRRFEKVLARAAVDMLADRLPPESDFLRVITDYVHFSGLFKTKKEADRATAAILEIYANRGTSFFSVFPYFNVEHFATLSAFAVLASYANLEDIHWMKERERFFSVPAFVDPQGCLISKPYHFWMAATLSARLFAKGNFRNGRIGPHLTGTLYEIVGETAFRNRSLIATHDAGSVHNASVRLNIILNDMGTAWIGNRFPAAKMKAAFPRYGLSDAFAEFEKRSADIGRDLHRLRLNRLSDALGFPAYLNQWNSVIAPQALYKAGWMN